MRENANLYLKSVKIQSFNLQNSSYYQNRTLLIKAKELAAKKDVEALKELSETEVEKFMSLWSSNKAFRDDYERRTLPSYDIRQLSRDGRIWNPDEKPLVSLDASTPSQTELVVKTNVNSFPRRIQFPRWQY